MTSLFRDRGRLVERLHENTPLSLEECRAALPLLGSVVLGAGSQQDDISLQQRVQIDIALHQIDAINRFNEVSGKLTKVAILVSSAQVLVALIAVTIAICR